MRIGRIAWLVWLLCATITAASLDSVPDPPAIKQRVVHSPSFDIADQLQHAVVHARLGELDCYESQCPALWPAFQHVSDPPCAAADSPLMRQAADPSPPTSVR